MGGLEAPIQGMGEVGGVWEGVDDEVEDEKEEINGDNDDDDCVDGGNGGEEGIERRGVDLPIRGG